MIDVGEMYALILRMRDCLHFVAANLIVSPEHAQLKVNDMSPGVLNFKRVMMKRDVAMLIGMEFMCCCGFTRTSRRLS
jgi:hypothetical protein